MPPRETPRLRKQLLLVDDDPRNLLVLEARLQFLGHRLDLAQSGAAAIVAFDAQPPDLVLLDFAMPGIDGLGVLAHIRASANPHVPVILVTAHADREHRLRGLEAGADEFLEKPLDAPLLIARVRTLLALKEARDELEASRDALAARSSALERLQSEQRELMHFIIHDLKTPIGLVIANLQLAQESAQARDLSATLETLADAAQGAQYLRSMVLDLLAVARLEESKFPLTPEVLSVQQLVDSVVAGYACRAEQKQLSVVQSCGADGEIWGDPTLLRRVLENLLENSLRHTPASGRVGVDARVDRGVEIAISNNGPPIPPEDRSRVFDKFVQGRPESAGSSGLGLYFCKRVVEAHNGKVAVSQTTEWPVRFVIELPRHLA